MNKYAIYHRPESNYCFAYDSKTVTLRIRFEHGEQLKSVSVLYNTKYQLANMQYRKQLTFLCTDGTFDYYATTLKLTDSRLAYVFEIITDKTYYFCEVGLKEQYDFSVAYYDSFQFAYINESDTIQNVSWLNNAVFYQIFIDRFASASSKNKSYINAKWGDAPTPQSFFGGDLDGIVNNLDYIQSLGATALYLTPIFKSKSNHKYDIIDYYQVDEMFGGNDALARLVKQCHARGIKVVLDAVFNHVSEQFEPFQDVLKNGKESKYFNWFVIDGDSISNAKDNYCCFAECKYMPKLNTNNGDVQQYLLDIAEYWIMQYDIDGWRLDVSDEVSHKFWRAMRKRVKSIKKQAVLIGENWHNSETYLNGDQFDGIMNYGITKAMLDYWVNKTVDEKSWANSINAQLMRYTDITNGMMFNLLDCHDTHRFFTLVNKSIPALICALACLVFLPGSVNLYYGTEILTEGGFDPDSRRTFDWDRVNNLAYQETSERIVALLNLKKQPAIQKGTVRVFSKNNCLVIERKCGEQILTLYVGKGNGGTIGNTTISFNLDDDMRQGWFAIKGDLL